MTGMIGAWRPGWLHGCRSLAAASLLAITLTGCAQPLRAVASCDPNPDPTALDPTNVLNRFSTGAGGSQSLGSGSNVNGPEVSAVGISDCYLKSAGLVPHSP